MAVRLILGCFFCMLIVSATHAQNISELKSPPTLLERYLIDYEIVGLENPTESDLSALDLNQYEDQRLQNESIVITDITTGYTIILYSINESMLNWYGHRGEKTDRQNQ